MQSQVTAYAPASVSNVSCGFDIMGFALDGAGDTVTVRRTTQPGVRMGTMTGCPVALPADPAANTAGPPLIALLREFAPGSGVEIDQD